MPPKTIKLGKKDDIAAVVKQIKDLRDRDVVFELERGSLLLRSSDNLKLMKRTGEVLGKKIQVVTDDEIGRILAKKAGVLFGGGEVSMPKTSVRVARSDIKPKFSDILGGRRILARSTDKPVSPMTIMPAISLPKIKFRFGWLKNNFVRIAIVVLVVLVLAVFVLAIFLPKASITIYARSEQVTRDLELTVDKNFTTINTDNLQIPGVSVTKEESLTKHFPATGVALSGTKASGTVAIYNFTKNTLTLKAATTTLQVNDKKYVFTKDVTGIKPNGAVTEASIMAQQPGDTYNQPANTKFQILNPALGNQNVYALNPEALGGGNATSTPMVSQEDLNKAAQSLAEEILVQVESDLSKDYGVPMKLELSGVTEEILTKTANKNVGDAGDSFDMTMIARVTGLSFKESDVVDSAIAKINQVLSSDKYLINDAKKDYSAVFKSIDLPTAHGVLAVHFTTTAAYKVDTGSLAKILAGKNENEIKEILLSKPEIDNVQVKFWPAWFVHQAPKLNGKVYVDIILNNNQ
jgi:hypothetical protein